jgi:hypothetical protein
MRIRTIVCALSVLSLALWCAKLSSPTKVHAGEGMDSCVNMSGDNNNDTVFTNNCNEDINLTVAGPRGVWAPGLLHPGGTMSHDNGNGPFRYFACTPPAIPYDANNQNRWPNYNSNDYVCK